MFDWTERSPLQGKSNATTSDASSSTLPQWSWCARLSTGAALATLTGVNLFLCVQLQAVTYQVTLNTQVRLTNYESKFDSKQIKHKS